MNDEMFETLWANGQEMFRRWKAHGDPRPSHGRTRACVQAAMRELTLPDNLQWGGVMRFPCDLIQRGEERQPIVATSRRVCTTEGFDHIALGIGVRRLFEDVKQKATVFIYMPPLPSPPDGSGRRGWGIRFAIKQGHGWELAPG